MTMDNTAIFLRNLPDDMDIQAISNEAAQGYLLSHKIELAYFIPLEHLDAFIDPAGQASKIGKSSFLNLRKQLSNKGLEYQSKIMSPLLRRTVETQLFKNLNDEYVPCPYPEELQ